MTNHIPIALIIIQIFFTNFHLRSQSLKKEIKFSDHKTLPFYGFKKKNNTILFQGNKKRKNYFEGWYFKMVSKDGGAILSVIPGISLSENGEKQHAFIQIINGKTAETYYYKFSIEEFYFSKEEFAIKIGENYFSRNQLNLNLIDSANTISGSIKMQDITPYKIGKRTPAIMGWYRFVPFMECYHGVGSLTHNLSGSIIINSKNLEFDSGKGYIEKDWGSSMPEAWIWMQSNHFNDNESSFMLSIANIPWLGKSFTGFLGFFKFNNNIYRFATYTNARLELKMPRSNLLKIKITDKKKAYVIEAENNHTGLLKAPVNGAMDRRIAESINATIRISVIDNNDIVLYSDSSQITGLEMVGDINQLMGTIK